MSLFGYIATNYVQFEITWDRIAEALEEINGDLAISIREKYCKRPTGK